jgi:hypothetical protein
VAHCRGGSRSDDDGAEDGFAAACVRLLLGSGIGSVACERIRPQWASGGDKEGKKRSK